MAKNTLRKIDFQADAWTRLKEWAGARREELRSELESDTADERISYKLRGRLAQLNELLGLEKQAPAQVQRTGDTLSADAPVQPPEADPLD